MRRRNACASVDCGDGTAVLGVGLFARPDNGRPFLAIADCRDPPRGNPRCDQHVLGRLSAPLAEREVIFARASLVAMAFDRDGDIRVSPQPIGLPRQNLLRLGRDIGPVEGEEHAVAGTRFQILLRSRETTPRADPAGPGSTEALWSPWPARWRGRLRTAAGSNEHQNAQYNEYFSVHVDPPH